MKLPSSLFLSWSPSVIVVVLLLDPLLRQEHRLDVRQDSALGDVDPSEQLVELLVVADSQLDVAGRDAQFVVVAGGVAGQFEDLKRKGS
jgi:hypothetical protein